jgi:hypothetical protein
MQNNALLKFHNFNNKQNKVIYPYLNTSSSTTEDVHPTLHFYEVNKKKYKRLKLDAEKNRDTPSFQGIN